MIGLLVVVATIKSPLRIERDGEIWLYAETHPEIHRLLPALSADEMDELSAAITELIKRDPDSDATKRVRRVYESAYHRGMLTAEQKQRIDLLLGKQRLNESERAELKFLRARFKEELAPPW